jgi:2-polyprenyl-6-methoxyphenol hydroxylase-like FAD-dependent oxidoreductase
MPLGHYNHQNAGGFQYLNKPPSHPYKSLNMAAIEILIIGGAVNLTPNAVRCLDILGVLDVLKTRKVECEINLIQLFSLHTGSSLGMIDYNRSGNGFGGYRGRRVMRSELMQAMLDVAQKLEIQIEYGKKLAALEETPQSVTVKSEDGTDATGNLVLGCDGIHSATRIRLETE